MYGIVCGENRNGFTDDESDLFEYIRRSRIVLFEVDYVCMGFRRDSFQALKSLF